MAYIEKVLMTGNTGASVDGVAGSPSTQAVTVQGNASGTAIPVSATSLPLPTGAAQESGNLATLAGAVSSSKVQVNVTNSSLAVTGTFYPATQPVSGTVVAEIEGHAGATIDGAAGTPSTQCLTIQGNSGGTAVPVSGTFYPATQPVSGTFWQSTQPVSIATLPALVAGSATIGGVEVVDSGGTNKLAVNASGQIAVSNFPASQAVTGTFYQATQPVSGTVAFSNSTLAVTNAGTFATQATLNAETTKVIGTVNVSSGQSIAITQATASSLNATVVQGTGSNLHTVVDSGTITTVSTVTAVTAITNAVTVAQATPASLQATVTPISITKGTQGSTGFTVQELKDAGRTQLTFYLDGIAGVSSEALATMNITKGLVAQTAATSYTVTTGKTLRLQSIVMTIACSTTTALTSAKVRVRAAASSFSVTSPVICAIACTPPTGAAVAGASATINWDFPDGVELASTQILGISQIISSASSVLSVCLIGYEY